jgi:hypothetical protein
MRARQACDGMGLTDMASRSHSNRIARLGSNRRAKRVCEKAGNGPLVAPRRRPCLPKMSKMPSKRVGAFDAFAGEPRLPSEASADDSRGNWAVNRIRCARGIRRVCCFAPQDAGTIRRLFPT